MKASLAAASLIWLSLGSLASGHRLDEFLQATTIELQPRGVQGQIRLTPGIAVFAFVKAGIDTDRDGVISSGEQRACAERVLRDLSLVVDGRRLGLQLVSMSFPGVNEMKEGLGEIQIEFRAEGLNEVRDHQLVFENRHQRRISAYLVNCLVPRDPDIRVTGQSRNYDQSLYHLNYEQGGVRSRTMSWAWLGLVAMRLSGRLVLLGVRSAQTKGESFAA